MVDVFKINKILIAVQCVYDTFHLFCKRIGLCCNASRSRPFTKAECNVLPICNCGEGDDPVSVDFKFLFETGFQLISELKLGHRNYEEIEVRLKKALRILDGFMKRKSYHEERLQKLLNDGDKPTEITTALAEHLLVQLAPGQSYNFDKRYSDKSNEVCRCGCGVKIKFGDTGIGHEAAWHGFIDITLSSREDGEPETAVVTIADTEPGARMKEPDIEPVAKKSKQDLDITEGSDKKENSSDGNCDAKNNLNDNTDTGGDDIIDKYDSDDGIDTTEDDSIDTDDSDDSIDTDDSDGGIDTTEDQSVAKAIVFSMLQNSRHSQRKTRLIPTIVISQTQFRILMYDPNSDILLQSRPVELFTTRGSSELSTSSIVILWMVLHYRTFCSGLKELDLYEELDKVKSGFMDKLTPEYMEIYKSKLKSGVASFPVVQRKNYVEDSLKGRNPLYKPLKPSCILDFGLNMD